MEAMVQYRETVRRRESEARQKLLARRERALKLAQEAAPRLRQTIEKEGVPL
jgi:hypothetical protein